MAKIYGVTTQTNVSGDKRIGVIKEDSNGNLSYSTDGLTFKTVSGGSSTGAKGYDYVIAPSDSGITNADLVLTGTDDQTAINKFITDTVVPTTTNTGVTKTIKFLGGTVKLTGTVVIPVSVRILGDNNVTFIDSENSYTPHPVTNLSTIFKLSTDSSDGFYFEGINFEFRSSNSTYFEQSKYDLIFKNCDFGWGEIDTTIVRNTTGSVVLDSCITSNFGSTNYTITCSELNLINSELNAQNFKFDAYYTIQNCNFNIKETINFENSTVSGHHSQIQNCNFTTSSSTVLQIANSEINNSIFEIGSGATVTLRPYQLTNCNFIAIEEATSDTNVTITSNVSIKNCNFTTSYSEGPFILDLDGNLIQNCNFDIIKIKSIKADTLDSCNFIANEFSNNSHESIDSDPVLSINKASNSKIINCNFRGCHIIDNFIQCNFIDNCQFVNMTYQANSIEGRTILAAQNGSITNCNFNKIILDDIDNYPAQDVSSRIYSLLSGFTIIQNCNISKLSFSTKAKYHSVILFDKVETIGNVLIKDSNTKSETNKIDTLIQVAPPGEDSLIIYERNIQNIEIVDPNFTCETFVRCLQSDNRLVAKVSMKNIELYNGSPIYDVPEIDDLTIHQLKLSPGYHFVDFNYRNKTDFLRFNNIKIKKISVSATVPLVYLDPDYIPYVSCCIFSNIYCNGDSSTSYTLADLRNTVGLLCCNDLVLAGNGLSGSLTPKDFLGTIPEVLVYNNFTIKSADDVVNYYSSNAAVKISNNKPYMYNESTKTWLELQTVSS